MHTDTQIPRAEMIPGVRQLPAWHVPGRGHMPVICAHAGTRVHRGLQPSHRQVHFMQISALSGMS